MAIYVTGDTHGSANRGSFRVDGFLHRFSVESFPEQKELTKSDFAVICGDFGGVWNYSGETKEEKYALDWLEKKPFTTLFVPGNHENYDRLTGLNDPELIDSWIFKNCSKEEKQKLLTGYPQQKWHGGIVREIRPSVLMLERGYVFDIDGAKCFAFGGANCHDVQDGILKTEDFTAKRDADSEYKRWSLSKRLFRVSHISWWEQEMPDKEEMNRGFEMLEKEGYKVDFIFTHDGPSSALPFILGDCHPDDLNRYLEKVKQKTLYKKWLFGHYHDNVVIPGGNDAVLYEQIIRIK